MNIQSLPFYPESSIRPNTPVEFKDLSELQSRCRKLGNEILSCQYDIENGDENTRLKSECEVKRRQFRNLHNIILILRKSIKPCLHHISRL